MPLRGTPPQGDAAAHLVADGEHPGGELACGAVALHLHQALVGDALRNAGGETHGFARGGAARFSCGNQAFGHLAGEHEARSPARRLRVVSSGSVFARLTCALVRMRRSFSGSRTQPVDVDLDWGSIAHGEA